MVVEENWNGRGKNMAKRILIFYTCIYSSCLSFFLRGSIVSFCEIMDGDMNIVCNTILKN